MLRAVWNGVVLAESEDTVRLEGNHYFPATSLSRAYLVESETTTRCAWKGVARYYHVIVDGKVNPDAAWYYPQPSPAAHTIADHVAFWHGVRIEHVPGTETGHIAGALRSRLHRLLGRPGAGRGVSAEHDESSDRAPSCELVPPPRENL
ncbi:MAG: DUF427 domain-containing protein [Longispora sp.]|nr:DUF427 domain-containing protein [Longispora sp. (in: high G+C Gram-positive bacteria)]